MHVLFSRNHARYRANMRLQVRGGWSAIISLVFCAVGTIALAEDNSPALREPAPAAGKCQVVRNPFLTSCTSGRSDSKKNDDWCAEHASPESRCVVCNPDLAKRDPE